MVFVKLKVERDISEFFLDMTVFFNEKNSRHEVMKEISIFVNQSNINKPGLDLAQIQLKYFKVILRIYRYCELNLTDP